MSNIVFEKYGVPPCTCVHPVHQNLEVLIVGRPSTDMEGKKVLSDWDRRQPAMIVVWRPA